ncbi:MAG: hypothetical protein HC875_01140 [Anaerolineales bacterium]|nr:hypothetical protein [Anaerolineales bacterium]
MIDNIVGDFIRARHIDSVQKLYVLLFLYQHPKLVGTSQQLANQLYLGHLTLVEEILNDLHRVGLIERIGKRYRLCNDSKVGSCLQSLVEAAKDPVARQRLLAQIGSGHHFEWSEAS